MPGTIVRMGVDGNACRKQTAAGNRCWHPNAGDGPARGASGRPGVGAGLYATVSDRRFQGVWHGTADSPWLLDATGEALRPRTEGQTALDVPARAALCAS